MTQSYSLRTLSGISVLILTITNIFLTVRLLHSNNCSSSPSSSSPYLSNNNNNYNNDRLIPEAPRIITSKSSCNDYETQQQQQQQQLQDITNNNKDNNNIENDSPSSLSAIATTNNNHQNYYFNNEKFSLLYKLQKFNFHIGRWDNQHLFKLFDFILIGTKFIELSKNYTICLATQSSIERLNSIVQVSEHWNGPISLSIYTAGDDEFIIFQLYINYLYNCYRTIRENLSIHLAVPKDQLPNSFNLFIKSNKNQKFHNFIEINHNLLMNCGIPSEFLLKRLLKLRTNENIKWRQKHPYPQNLMRNLARKGCQTSNVFLTDVDIIPSYNFTQNVDKFLRKTQCKGNNNGGNGNRSLLQKLNGIVNGGSKGGSGGGGNSGGLCAYVVPTYEIDFRVKFPANKSDLLRLVNKGLARPFHEKVFVYNQFATNFSRWQKNDTSDIDTHISHDVTNFEFLYEPFYISSDNVPIHDERFLGYGFTRNSQVYEMYIAGYKFQVLSPVFTCHWGLQQKKTRPAWREQQNNINRKHFEHFKKEILARYSKDIKGSHSPV